MLKKVPGAAFGIWLAATGAALAQSEGQCEQVRAAVAQYGYKAAKAHAEATMSPEAVRAADSCVRGHHGGATRHHVAMRKRHRVHHIVR